MAKKKIKSPRRAFPWVKMIIALSVLLLGSLAYLDAKVRYSLNDRQWQLPARVYARVLSLYPGKLIAADDLQRELQHLGYRTASDWQQPGTVKRQGGDFWIHSRGFNANGAVNNAQRFTVRIVNNTVEKLQLPGSIDLERAALEPLEIGSIYPRHQEDRILVKLDEVPSSLTEILLLVEDRDFYQHFGISPRSIARALVTNVKARRTLQGGSTITQQLVKNVFLTADRSLWRKGLEAVMSVLVEVHFSKEKILESYLNEVYLGQEGAKAIHGFALASRHYFNRPLEELNAAQIALMVGMVKGPSYFHPWRNPQRAKQRRNLVLSVMAEHQLITPQQSTQFKQQSLGLVKSNAREFVFPAYLDLVRRQLRRDYNAQSLQTEGMKIFTAFDPIAQHHAEVSVAAVLSAQPESLQGAMVVTNVSSGDVVAVVGGRKMRYAGFNRALDAVRPIGSLIKPAVYLAALQQSHRYSLATRISDAPVEVAGRDGTIWRPRNFDRKNHGSPLLHSALANSYNQATARLGMDIGLSEVISMVEQLGVKRPISALPSMLLGAVGLSPFEVAAMYQTIASAGVYSPLRSIVDITDKDDVVLARYPVVRKVAVEKPLMHLLHYSMLEVVQEGTGKSVYQTLPADYLVAGKTGTTNDLRDSWFAGFAGDYLSVVWLGRDDNGGAGLTGSSGALKVWRKFFEAISYQPLDFSVPAGIAYHWIDSQSGLLSREVCEGARYMPFLQGTAPTERSSCRATLPGVLQWFKNLF